MKRIRNLFTNISFYKGPTEKYLPFWAFLGKTPTLQGLKRIIPKLSRPNRDELETNMAGGDGGGGGGDESEFVGVGGGGGGGEGEGNQSPPNRRFFVAVHVGAGFHAPANEKAYRRAMKRACLAAAAVLREVLYFTLSPTYPPLASFSSCSRAWLVLYGMELGLTRDPHQVFHLSNGFWLASGFMF